MRKGNPRFTQVTDSEHGKLHRKPQTQSEKLPGKGSSLGEGRREAVVLETKRENPKGKIRGITIVGRAAAA